MATVASALRDLQFQEILQLPVTRLWYHTVLHVPDGSENGGSRFLRNWHISTKLYGVNNRSDRLHFNSNPGNLATVWKQMLPLTSSYQCMQTLPAERVHSGTCENRTWLPSSAWTTRRWVKSICLLQWFSRVANAEFAWKPSLQQSWSSTASDLLSKGSRPLELFKT
jgi:hypothetical protein